MPLPERNLIGHIIHLSRSIERLCDEASRATGVTGSQARLLVFLSIMSGEQDIFQKDIEEEFGIRPSSVTGLLQTLEQEGMITREAVSSDGRLKKIVLTGKAKEIQTKLLTVHEQMIQQLRGTMSEEALRRFLRNCEQISRRAGEI